MKDHNLEFQTVVLAALLHDVGKLVQRGSFGSLDVSGRHPKVSADFVSLPIVSGLLGAACDQALLRTLVQHHHESPKFPPELRVDGIGDPHARTLAALVSHADNLSSSERGERSEQWQDFKATPLALPLGRLRRPDGSGAVDAAERLHAAPLTPPAAKEFAGIFPEQISSLPEGEMNALLQAFGKQFTSLAADSASLSFDALVAHLLNLLYTFAWCVPSNTQEHHPDVSLYDHLKGTAAIAACLHRVHSSDGQFEEKAIRDGSRARFLLLGGDFTGIQNYIFGVANQGAGGIARRLRARSMFIQLLTDATALALLRETGLPLSNLLMTAGGRFYVLLPNLEETSEVVNRLATKVDEWLLDELKAAIGLVFATVAFDDSGFKPTREGKTGFGQTLRALNAELAARKARPLAHALQAGQAWNQSRFLLAQPAQGAETCRGCQLFPVEAEGSVCEQCSRDRDLGGVLPGASRLELADQGEWPVFDRWLSVPHGNPRPDERGESFVWITNNPDARSALPLPATVKYVARHVPMSGRDPVTFEEMARKAKGKHLLGFLKADADRMGELIGFGLRRKPPEGDLDTVSRVIGVSRSLELFFSGWIEHLLESDFSDCYAVFSGGDDLFVVGPWDQTLRLAERVRDDFGRYTANPDITLSAAVLIADSAHPIGVAAEELERALESAKKAGRNRLSVFGRVMTWDDWRRIREIWEQLITSDEASKVSGRFLHNLRRYGQMWETYLKGDSLALRFQPRLAYDAARNLDRRKTPQVAQLVDRLLSVSPKDGADRWLLDHLSVLAQLLILSTRKEVSE
ncbi:MAG: type III-A CRISPR-associated protein Cas10/Csm1 [Bacillota bacterium]|nr:type III-A CRISPR-associated protein Cas10/Csm1 [Bacillota bacterium]